MATRATNSTKNDVTFDSVRTKVGLYLPQYPLSTRPPLFAGDGAIAYNIETQSPYFFDGNVWQPFLAPPSNTTNAYSFEKGGIQIVSPDTDTIVSGWITPVSPPYRVLSGWDMAQGVYTAPVAQLFTITAQISWSAGITNTGTRTLRVIYYDGISPRIVKENTIQPNPNAVVSDDQSISMSLQLNPGDRVWISVEQDTEISVTIDEGYHTVISGIVSTIPN